MGKRLAIRGHSTRGKEVIELLEMLGGKNICEHKYDGSANMYSYYLVDNIILSDRLSIAEDDDFEIFTLQGFLEKFPFKIHDLVNIPEYESTVGICGMRWDPYSKCIEYMVYRCDDEEWYTAEELLNWNDNPNETTDCKKCGLHFGSVQCFDNDCPNNTPKNMEDKKINQMSLVNCDLDEVEIVLGDRFELKTKDGKYYAVRKKPKYPTTYDECCDMLNADEFVEYELMTNFPKLINARNAYWKIAGEEMGLGKPWEPDWNDVNQPKFGIHTVENQIKCITLHVLKNLILVFPTVEMRDTFYENFKDLIEQCKKLL